MGDSLIDREGGNAGRRMIVLYFAGHGPGTGMTEDVGRRAGKSPGLRVRWREGSKRIERVLE